MKTNKQDKYKNMLRRAEDDSSELTVEEMDAMRSNVRIYEYMCRLEEAKQWCEDNGCTQTSTLDEFEEEMRKGVILAQLTRSFASSCVKRIFVSDTLQYRHTDNINYFFDGLAAISFPQVFKFETFDLYDKKNIPRVIYCMHALAHYLQKSRKMIKMKNLVGSISFTAEEMTKKETEINTLGVQLPVFDDIREKINTQMDLESSKSILKMFYQYRVRRAVQKGEECDGDPSYLSSAEVLRRKTKALVWEKSFDDIIYQKRVSVHTLKRFLPFFFKQSEEIEKEREIEQLHTEIIKKRKTIFDLEAYLDEIKIKLALLADNKVTIANIAVTRPLNYVLSYLPMESDNYKTFQNIFYMLQNEPFYLFTILNNLNESKVDEFVCALILPLFSFVQGRREEFLISRLADFALKNESARNKISTRLIANVFRKSKEGLEFEKMLMSFIKELSHTTPEDVAKRTAQYLDDALRRSPMYLKNLLRAQDEISSAKNLFLDEFIAPYFVLPDLYDAAAAPHKRDAYKIIEMIRAHSNEFLTNKTFESDQKSAALQENVYAANKKSVLYLTTRECNMFLEMLKKNLKGSTNDLFYTTLSRAEPFEASEYLIPFYLNDPELIKTRRDENLALTNFINRTKQKVLFVLSISDGRNLREMLHSTEEKELAMFEKQLALFKDLNFDSRADLDSSGADSDEASQAHLKFEARSSGSELSHFKEALLEDLNYLESKSVIASIDDVLGMLAQDIVTLKLMSNERSSELMLNRSTKQNLDKKIVHLAAKSKAYEEYLVSFTSKLVTRKKTALFGFEKTFEKEGKDSLFGTYRYSATKLRAKRVLVGAKDANTAVFDSAYFYLLCNDPLVFNWEMHTRDRMIGSDTVRMDDLLKMRCYGVKAIDICGVARFSVSGLIDMINAKYMD